MRFWSNKYTSRNWTLGDYGTRPQLKSYTPNSDLHEISEIVEIEGKLILIKREAPKLPENLILLNNNYAEKIREKIGEELTVIGKIFERDLEKKLRENGLQLEENKKINVFTIGGRDFKRKQKISEELQTRYPNAEISFW